tara:strand:+ start:343 stop:951 length:609 start_codon:yes stop_codon:yes gene_type:complete
MKGLYLITPDWEDTNKILSITEIALNQGICLLQYRNKFASKLLRLEQAKKLLKLCKKYNIPLIINDYVDLCLEIDAGGVHLGGEDVSVKEARHILGENKIIGASCYGNFNKGLLAKKTGANYLAFGGFYPSRVKKYSSDTPINIISKAKKELSLPVCAIGGISETNAEILVKEGADMIAIISSVFMANNPEKVIKQLNNFFL